MGRLSKFLFVQDSEEELPVYEQEEYVEAIADINTDGVSTENFIKEIYEKNNMSDYSKSIFKVGDIMDALPKEMPDATKKETIHTLLSSFGITADDVYQDGLNRINLIKAAQTRLCEECKNTIGNNAVVINQKKEEIEALEKENAYQRSVIEDTDKVTEDEVKSIEYLVGFIGG